jgi:hypothetical protein
MVTQAMTPQQLAALRELMREQRAREVELLNQHAGALNAAGDDSAAYQAPWDTE